MTNEIHIYTRRVYDLYQFTIHHCRAFHVNFVVIHIDAVTLFRVFPSLHRNLYNICERFIGLSYSLHHFDIIAVWLCRYKIHAVVRAGY